MEQNTQIPLRLHHNAYVVRDQRVTRRFYEDVLGIPMVACWTEQDDVFGGLRVYCHTFFQLADGGALAFFQFADPADYERFGPQFRIRRLSISRSRPRARPRRRSPRGSSRPAASTS